MKIRHRFGGNEGLLFGHAFSLSDANNDSVISSAEFDGEAKRTFAGYDQNKDGRLSRDEYSGPGSVRSPMGGFVKEQPDKLDSDHDGAISEAEFLREGRRVFDKLDLNRDGNLSAAECCDLPAGGSRASGGAAIRPVAAGAAERPR